MSAVMREDVVRLPTPKPRIAVCTIWIAVVGAFIALAVAIPTAAFVTLTVGAPLAFLAGRLLHRSRSLVLHHLAYRLVGPIAAAAGTGLVTNFTTVGLGVAPLSLLAIPATIIGWRRAASDARAELRAERAP